MRPPAADWTKHGPFAAIRVAFSDMWDSWKAWLRAFRAELGADMKTIGTGALVEVIARETRSIDFIEPWLALRA